MDVFLFEMVAVPIVIGSSSDTTESEDEESVVVISSGPDCSPVETLRGKALPICFVKHCVRVQC